jgi:hypothetical protein
MLISVNGFCAGFKSGQAKLEANEFAKYLDIPSIFDFGQI